MESDFGKFTGATLQKSAVHPEPLLYLCWGVHLLVRAAGIPMEPPSDAWLGDLYAVARWEAEQIEDAGRGDGADLQD